jgi:hypothetical protein
MRVSYNIILDTTGVDEAMMLKVANGLYLATLQQLYPSTLGD